MPGNSPAAIAHAALGQVDAYDAHDVHLVFLLVDPKWDTLRADGRFADLLRCCRFTTLAVLAPAKRNAWVKTKAGDKLCDQSLRTNSPFLAGWPRVTRVMEREYAHCLRHDGRAVSKDRSRLDSAGRAFHELVDMSTPAPGGL
jgi:hypothetical protein